MAGRPLDEAPGTLPRREADPLPSTIGRLCKLLRTTRAMNTFCLAAGLHAHYTSRVATKTTTSVAPAPTNENAPASMGCPTRLDIEGAVAEVTLRVPRKGERLRPRLLFVLLLGALGLLYRDVIPDLVGQWQEDPNYSHGFLVPLFSGFLVWQRRRELATLTPHGSWAGLLVLLSGLGALLLGDIASEYFLKRASLIIVLAGLVLWHCGQATLRVVAFPLAFLLFMVPLPGILFSPVTLRLQNLAAQNAAWGLDLLGVPVLLDGNVIHLSQISLGVTEACSGIRSLISLAAVAVAWAYLSIPGIWGMVVLVAATVPITVMTNAGRVVATGLIGRWFGAEYADGIFHGVTGWVLFVVGFACLWGVHTAVRLARAGGRGR